MVDPPVVEPQRRGPKACDVRAGPRRQEGAALWSVLVLARRCGGSVRAVVPASGGVSAQGPRAAASSRSREKRTLGAAREGGSGGCPWCVLSRSAPVLHESPGSATGLGANPGRSPRPSSWTGGERHKGLALVRPEPPLKCGMMSVGVLHQRDQLIHGVCGPAHQLAELPHGEEHCVFRGHCHGDESIGLGMFHMHQASEERRPCRVVRRPGSAVEGSRESAQCNATAYF